MLPSEWQPQVIFPLILGTDISGVVEAVADDVENFSVGDEVYSMVRFPSGLAGDSKAHAEYVSVPASEVALKPTGIDHVHAVGAPMSLLTAWQFMIELGHNEPNPLQPNQHEPVPLYFDGEASNAADPVLALVPTNRRATLIATRKPGSGNAVYCLDIHMQGDNETVFFDV
jgi:hypothetical protein